METSKREDIICKLRSLKETLSTRYHITGVSLFGSVAREGFSEKSDIDILVDFDEKATLFDLSGAADFLEGKLGRKVDIVPRRALRHEIREKVLREAIRI